MSTKATADKTAAIPAVDYDFKNLSGAELMAFAANLTKTTAKIEKAKVDAMIAAMVANYEALAKQLDATAALNTELKAQIADMETTNNAVVKRLREDLGFTEQLMNNEVRLRHEAEARYNDDHDASVAAVAKMEGMRETMQTIFAVPTTRESLQRRVLQDGTLQEDKTTKQS